MSLVYTNLEFQAEPGESLSSLICPIFPILSSNSIQAQAAIQAEEDVAFFQAIDQVIKRKEDSEFLLLMRIMKK